MIEYILFDMDNCLYPASSGLCNEMDRRISGFTADLLAMSFEEAHLKRRESVKTFGTTLKWLESEHGFTDVDEYNRFMHPANVEDFLKPSPGLKAMLDNLPCRLSVLTNAPSIHADRVLSFLGITSCFEYVFELGFSGTKGKPHRQTFEKALEICDCDAENTLFLDDMPGHLCSFSELGGEILLVDEDGRHAEKNLPSISDIMELPAFLCADEIGV